MSSRLEELELRMDYLDERVEDLYTHFAKEKDWWRERVEEMRERFFREIVAMEERLEKVKGWQNIREVMV